MILARGQVTIQMSGDNPIHEPLEYRYRVNDGRWSIWKEREAISLQRMLSGQHCIEVCSRTHLLKESETCATTDFKVGK